jgi:DNA-binding MarR family transcriptional regulator
VQIVMRALHATDAASWCAVDLTMPQLKTLLLADSPDGVCHGDIARGLGVGVSTVTGIVDRLVEHGLVERHTAPEDRRQSRVRITTTGKDLLDGLWATHRERLGEALAALNPEERARLQTALLQLADLLGEQS